MPSPKTFLKAGESEISFCLSLLLVAQNIQLQRTTIMVGAGAGVSALVTVVVLLKVQKTMIQTQLLKIGHVN